MPFCRGFSTGLALSKVPDSGLRSVGVPFLWLRRREPLMTVGLWLTGKGYWASSLVPGGFRGRYPGALFACWCLFKNDGV